MSFSSPSHRVHSCKNHILDWAVRRPVDYVTCHYSVRFDLSTSRPALTPVFRTLRRLRAV